MQTRALVSERSLVAPAVQHLTRDALGDLPWESLGTTKSLLKRFFSEQSWETSDEERLADAVGPGTGWWRHQLDDELTLEFGWEEGRFRLVVTSATGGIESPDEHSTGVAFDGPVVPEATPNPRTVMFRTGPIHRGESRPFTGADQADDPRVQRLFRQFPDVVDVLLAADFVAVSIRRPEHWESLLEPLLLAISEEFVGNQEKPNGEAEEHSAPGAPASGPAAAAGPGRRPTRLQQAWRELGSLRAREPADLERIRLAAHGPDVAHRQVAASLLKEAEPETAWELWGRLASDPSRSVRRAAVDAMVDAGREELRSLLEQALGDQDPWVRWKALRGLAELGAGASRPAVAPLIEDRDFRVRLEALSALRSAGD